MNIAELEEQVKRLNNQIEKLEVLANKQSYETRETLQRDKEEYERRLRGLEEENEMLKKELDKIRYQRLHLIKGLEELRLRLEKASEIQQH
ncbi:hypothetical protein GpartN1_g178.t1 [Galdieria partita]|uniref:Uncharacterized protein n=1 Tax=Galdieria partita TaxID=83374 RepID=A0A9C7PQY4_9RHOD|nr:hypothetical protein GpartN1_g178.t1 [Galdieria partita]